MKVDHEARLHKTEMNTFGRMYDVQSCTLTERKKNAELKVAEFTAELASCLAKFTRQWGAYYAEAQDAAGLHD